jgi:stringent starvation protein B
VIASLEKSLLFFEEIMLSNKPYLVRAFYEWIVDSACTPFIVINATMPRCKLPQDFIENGQITLNISPNAIRDLKVTNESIEFRASFSGVVHIVSAPIKAVLAIYAQENQQGMFFDYEEDDDTTSDWSTTEMPLSQSESVNNAQDKKRSSHLRLVE